MSKANRTERHHGKVVWVEGEYTITFHGGRTTGYRINRNGKRNRIGPGLFPSVAEALD